MKRFTDTAKWSDPWFCSLTMRQKLLWIYLCDNCDNAGVIDLNRELVDFLFKVECKWVDDLRAFDDRVTQLECGKLWIRKFVEFQFGKLSEDCRPHQAVLALMRKYNLQIPYLKGSGTLQEQDKEKDKDSERKGSREGKPSEAFGILDYLNQKTGRNFQSVHGNLRFIAARLAEGATMADCKLVVDFKVKDWLHDAKMKEYLRPQTLFNSEKFPAYLAAATAKPIVDANAKNGF